ncbi:MAG TPA: hypothetical protein DCY75_03720, partial [Clostridiales bacterium]|nr:hypothetical protein [Clostridiales bacterium]
RNGTFSVDGSPCDHVEERKVHPVINNTSYLKKICETYTHPQAETVILDGGDWGTFAVMAFVPYADAYIYIGEQANISTFRGIFKDAKGDSTVHFVFKERSTTITLSDIFGNVWSGTKAPSTTLFGEYIFQTKNVSITGKAMETAKVEGQGYFIQTFDGYNN